MLGHSPTPSVILLSIPTPAHAVACHGSRLQHALSLTHTPHTRRRSWMPRNSHPPRPAHCKARVVNQAGPETPHTQARCEARDRDAGRDSIGNSLDATHPGDTANALPWCVLTPAPSILIQSTLTLQSCCRSRLSDRHKDRQVCGLTPNCSDCQTVVVRGPGNKGNWHFCSCSPAEHAG